jgi:ABC-type multidrug transport system permease subunit
MILFVLFIIITVFFVFFFLSFCFFFDFFMFLLLLLVCVNGGEKAGSEVVVVGVGVDAMTGVTGVNIENCWVSPS